jgi:predicted nucleic acid-binding protein
MKTPSQGPSAPAKGSPSAAPAGQPDGGRAGCPVVIDTSVALKWYIPESFSSEAKLYLARRIDRHAPDYLLSEAASVLLKRVRPRQARLRLARAEAHMVLAALKTAPIVFHETRPLIDPALALAEEIGASLYDGLFLALALQLGGRIVTADAKLFKRIAASRHAPYGYWVELAP